MPGTAKTQRRKTNRKTSDRSVVRIELKDGLGHARWVTADIVDRSEQGIGLSLMSPLKSGLTLQVSGKLGEDLSEVRRSARVSWCVEGINGTCRVGLEFLDGASGAQHGHQIVPTDPLELDCYEIMQLSPNADTETIERVYRMLAQRYHPDNVQTGSAEVFIRLSEANRILSDPELRAGYDARHRDAKRLHWKIFDQAQAATGVEAEKRKRQGILSLLHAKTLQDPERAAIGLLSFEELLGCPREHLLAALWYLRGKGFIERADNGRFTITVEGFDAAEAAGAVPLASPTQRQITGHENQD
jgi:DnaJ-like protein/PilZ domain-containing protein